MSAVFKYFTKIPLNDKAKCNICDNKFSYKDSSTKGLWDHLKLKHPKEYKKEKSTGQIETELNQSGEGPSISKV